MKYVAFNKQKQTIRSLFSNSTPIGRLFHNQKINSTKQNNYTGQNDTEEEKIR